MNLSYRERTLARYKRQRANNVGAVSAWAIAKFHARYCNCQKRKVINEGRGTLVRLPFGFQLVFLVQKDLDMPAPWRDCDGVGIVKESRKHPGPSYEDWILDKYRGFYRYYDWKATLPIAMKEGWDSPPYFERDRQLRALRAMRREYRYFARWCEGLWHYVYYRVTLLDPEENEIANESCGGYSSEYLNYLASEARSAAAWILKRAHRKFWAERGDMWRQYQLELEEV
jgi:hypothetical protein